MATDTVFYGYARPTSSNKTVLNADEDKNQEDILQKVNQAMYRQNFELANRNKTLSVLRTLYAITLKSLKVNEIAQQIVDTLTKELNFSAVLISIVDTEKKQLRPIAITNTPLVQKAWALVAKSFSEMSIDLTNNANLIVSSLSSKERKITSNLLDILIPLVTQDLADEIENVTNIKTVIIYPLLIGEKAVGALSIGLGKRVDDLSKTEKDTLDQLINLVSIALDRAQIHEDLQKANIKLQELDKLKDEFVSLASHELRTPMTAIKGSLSTILEGFAGEITPQSREFLTAAFNENDRLIRLVNNLLNISRIEAGRFTFSVTKVDLYILISEVVHNLESSAQEKNLFLKYEKQTDISLVLADSDKIKEVLINLIGNAIKFTHHGGITVTARVQNQNVVTSVADTGSGIAPEDQELLFKKFSQVQGNYTKQAGGTGLGLYISKQIVEGLQGTVWLESTLGKGSTFYFTLPSAS